MATRTLARPVVLLLTSGWLYGWDAQHGDVPQPAGMTVRDFPAFPTFEPQKPRAIRRGKRLVVIFAAFIVILIAYVAARSRWMPQ